MKNRITIKRPKLLLHICCAPDSTHVAHVLDEEYEITGYFYNPNIYPEEEYELRWGDLQKIAEEFNFNLLNPPYDPDIWFSLTKGLENEPEGGKRCERCFLMRLEKTAKIAKEKGYDIFTTTLTISPHKNANLINSLGRSLSEKYKADFLAADFKKQDGFKKSIELSKRYNLYRQNYCGCLYSKR
ncbi:MAG TPA: epoxyqueuosine reductase QueH [Nitrospinota bacterium]|nr:epoxyqueuosine reductase QueH [Nitrospinota bacterium]